MERERKSGNEHKNRGEHRNGGVIGAIIAIVVVLIGGLIAVGIAGGWFDDPVTVLDEEYYCGAECDEGFMELDAGGYDALVDGSKSFVVFVDQNTCTTADRMREYVTNWAREAGVRVYRIMFSDMKESRLHEVVKYYPSVVVVGDGTVRAYLRADSDEDAEYYNDYEKFKEWMGERVGIAPRSAS